ncbi:methyltransferase 5 [Micractinium conductrix]|uniref:Methyltransferase 5 n=1 Tax=Micractinium conductrix TaxID=554055 RepID=A0A2P6VC91_9CHLO|nr:methyltransferase 5 [Micractinium conductrix]|eukprot:PSC71671.1 methyltransferase 5 [Micractinium conductrix]
MKLKELESLMQDIAPFEDPKIDLEQYPTGPHLAARLLFTVANTYDEFDGQTVVDLGCGTAMLSIGAAMLGAQHVIGLDIDDDALRVAQSNVEEYEDPLPIDFVKCDVRQVGLQARLKADTVVTNPPFGTRRKGADMEFLRAAFALSRNSIYSLHKSSTRDYIQKFAQRELHASSAEVLAQLRYDLPASYKFHKQKSKDIEVDLWRFEVQPQTDPTAS